MPDSAVALAEGLRAEKLGILDRAVEAYVRAAAYESDPDVVAEALTRQADVLRALCEWDRAIAQAQRGRDVAARAGLPLRQAQAFNAEASVHIARGELELAHPLLEEMVRVSDDVRLRGIGLQNLGSVYAHQGQLDLAERMFTESFACFRECGYERGQAIALNNRGRAALDRGDVDRARELLEQAVDAARQVEDEELIALSTTNVSEAMLAAGKFERANDLVCAALGHFRTSGNRWREVECLRLLGEINARRGHHDDAVRCYERGLQLAEQIDARLEIANIKERLARLHGSR
jgi:tetratricopeptide (TPR) repeat protein